MLNPDEGQILAAAINMQFSPQPWLSADCATLGPVVFFIPQVLAFISGLLGGNGDITFFTARLATVLLATSGFIFIYKTALFNLDVKLARAVCVIFLCFFACPYNDDIRAYNSEFVFVFFHSVCLYFVFSLRQKLSGWKIISAALLIGASPYIKLQAPPILAVTALWIIFSICLSFYGKGAKKPAALKPLAIFFIGCILPTILLVLYCLSYGGLDRAYLSYWDNAFTGHIPQSTSFFLSYLYNFPEFLSFPEFRFIFICAVIAFAWAIFSLCNRRIKGKQNGPESRQETRPAVHKLNVIDLLFASLQFVVTLWAILRPGNSLQHYMLFLPTSALILIIISLKTADMQPRSLTAEGRFNSIAPLSSTIMALIIVTASAVNFKSPLSYIKEDFRSRLSQQLVAHNSPDFAELSKLILKETDADDSIYIWGWDMRPYVFTNRRSASPMTNILPVWPGKYSMENTDYFIDDLKRNQPKLIIDIVTPGSFVFHDNAAYGLERHRKVWKAVKDFYELTEIIPVKLDDEKPGSFKVYRRIKGRSAERKFERSSRLRCYYDGQPGGTAHTIRYAVRSGLEVFNLADYDLRADWFIHNKT